MHENINIRLILRSQHEQFDGEMLLGSIVDEKKHLARLSMTSISLEYSLYDVVEFNPETNEIISLQSKGTKAIGGKILSVAVTPYNEKTVIEEVTEHFEPYCCKVGWLFEAYFTIAIPLNMSEENFDRIVSKCFYKIKLGVGKEK